MVLEVLLPAAYAAFFILLIGKLSFFRLEGLSKLQLILLFLLKIGAGVGLSLIYTYHYTYRNTSDAFRYFDDAGILYSAIHHSPLDYLRMLTGIGADAPHLNAYYDQMLRWTRGYGGLYNDNRTIIRFNALLYLFSQGYYQVHTVFMCFISFAGLTAIYKTFREKFAGSGKTLGAAIFLLPSVLFWGSGVLKEGIILFALGLAVYYFFRMLNTRLNFRQAAWFILSLALLMILKYYVLFALLPSLIAAVWTKRSGGKRTFFKYAVVLGSTGLAILGAQSLGPDYNAFRILSLKQADFMNLARGGIYLTSDKHLIYIKAEDRAQVISLGTDSTFKIKPGSHYDYWSVNDVTVKMEMSNYQDTITYKLAWDIPPAGSRIEIPVLDEGAMSFLKAAANALFNVMFRPHLLEADSAFMLVAALENLLLLLLLLLVIMFPAKNSDKSPVLFCLGFVLLLFLLIGWVTPVLGAIVRYKVPGLPFLVIALLMLMDRERILFLFKRKKQP